MKAKLGFAVLGFVVAAVLLSMFRWPASAPRQTDTTPAKVKRVDGQAFVLTVNGDAQKLSLVTVKVFPKKRFDEALRKSQEDERALRATYGASPEFEQYDSTIKNWSSDLLRTATAGLKKETTPEGKELFNGIIRNEEWNLNQAIFHRKQAMAEMLVSAGYQCRPTAQTQTDADGRFTLEFSMEESQYYLFATVKYDLQTKLGKAGLMGLPLSNETLVWLLDDTHGSPVLLTDKNIYSVDKYRTRLRP